MSMTLPTPTDSGSHKASSPPGLALTARQTLIWLDHELFPNAPYQRLVLRAELEGRIDVERLERALSEAVRGSDALSSVIVEHDGPPRLRRTSSAFEVQRLAQTGELDALQQWIEERCAEPLRAGRLLVAAALLSSSAERHRLAVVVDQLVADEASLVLLLTQVAQRYNGVAVGSAPLFAEYAAAEADYRGSSAGRRDAAYWQQKLQAGSPPVTYYGRAREHKTLATDRRWVTLDPKLLQALTERAEQPPFRSFNQTLSRASLLASALFAYLYRVTGNRELSLLLPVQRRPRRFRNTLGTFVEQPLLRIEVAEEETFAALGERVRRELRQSLRHSRLAVSDRGQACASLAASWRPSSVRFGDANARFDLAPAPVVATSLGTEQGDTRGSFAIEVRVESDTGNVSLGFDFHEDTFPATLRERATRHFVKLLEAVVANPATVIDAIDLLDDSERELLLERGRGPQPAEAVPDLLDRLHTQAAERRSQVAVVSDTEQLTYAQVEARSNQLARRLQALGVSDGSRVGIYVSRGADELLTMLATLKAGAAYVPLDPSHPADRVQLVLEDAAPDVLVAHRRELTQLALSKPLTTLVLDEEWPDVLALDDSRVPLPPGDRLAYILFTSGSTGRPKGVEIPRSALANFLEAMAKVPGLSPSDRLLAITTITFDIAELELLLPLWVGATVRIASRETAIDPSLLKRVLEQEHVTVLQATPATWRLLIEAGWQGTAGLRMLCGGEALNPELKAALVTRGAELWNMYGPTETTVWSTVKRIEPDLRQITIGLPIDRTQIYVLDAKAQMVPEGVQGELCIGGAGVARGYRDRPELTQDRFIQNPYGPPGDRIYRTGDLARFLPNGELECLGRLDHQVKIRGFRIELGEIESVLRAIPAVRDAVVVARRDNQSADPKLVAYVVSEGELERQELAEVARRKLPAYMQPSAYVVLPEFPLTTSGKVDRKALPAPDESSLPARRVRTLPRSDVETRMAAIWSAVLGIEPIGVDDNFFDLGGSSPLAIEALQRINAEFRSQVPLRVLFETPTIEALVSRLGERATTSEPIVLKLRRGDDDKIPVFCVLGVNLYHDLAHALPAGRTVYGMHVPAHYVPSSSERPSVTELATRYVDLIVAERPNGPYHLAGLCFGGVVAFEIAQQLVARGHRVLSVSIFDGHLPRARRVDQVQRLRAVASDMTKPEHARQRLLKWQGRLTKLVQSKLARPNDDAPPSSSRRPREFDFVGPETEAVAARYEPFLKPIDAALLVFRAEQSRDAAWVVYDHDLGWGTLGSRVEVHRIPGDHLGILRDPNVAKIAERMAAVFADE